jgi:hypothetical protein
VTQDPRDIAKMAHLSRSAIAEPFHGLRFIGMRVSALIALFALSFPAQAQTSDPQGAPRPDGSHSGAPLAQFFAGPFIVTPTFRISSLAFDTNVRYTQERKPDFIASGGPGLDIALPFLDHWRLDVLGFSEYFYFQRTKDLRRWVGGGSAALDWKTTGTSASVTARINREFSRPNFEVDSRVGTRNRQFGARFERDLGRLTLALNAGYLMSEVEAGQEEFRGANLETALTSNRFVTAADLRLRLTPVTSFLIEGGYADSRFPRASGRNYTEPNVGAGFLTTGLIDGRITAGVRRTRLRSGNRSERTRPYLRADLKQQLGRRFTLTERYAHESAASAFATDGQLPTYERRSLDVDLRIEFNKRLDMKIGGTRDRTVSDGLVRVVLDDGTTQIAKRDDVAYIGRADIGMRLGRARVALFVSYTTRDSLYFDDFGIKGIQTGARVEYSPR